MSEINPYASPLAEGWDKPPLDAVGAWRQGDLLVMSRGWQLPLRCVATNRPADGYDSQAIEGIDPPVSLPFASSYLGYVRFQATIAMGLLGLGLAWLFVVVPAMFIFSNGRPTALEVGLFIEFSVIAGFLFLLVGAFWSRAVGQLLYLHASTPHHVWIVGVHPDFLATLPQWPYQPK